MEVITVGIVAYRLMGGLAIRQAEYHNNAEHDFSKPYRLESLAEKSKFIPSIATAPFPINAKIPTSVGTYNGMTDPSDHLLKFEAVGGVSGWTLPYWFHMFALTFTGAAREWFEKLPYGKIKSWKDFVAKFSQHFNQQRKHTRDLSEILNVERRNNESIKDFITHFNNKSLNIGGVSEDMLRGAFCKNVHSNTLIRTLTGKDGMPESWDEIITAAKLFARTKRTLGSDSQKQLPRVEFQTPRPNRQAKGPIWSRLQPSAETSKPFDARSLIGNKNKRNFPARSSNSSWTQLSKTPSEILTTENLTFRKPQPMPRKSFLDSKKHCTYHNDIGHNTNECVALRNEIEAAVKNGKLDHLVKSIRPRAGKAPTKDNQGSAKRQIKDLNVHMNQGGQKPVVKKMSLRMRNGKTNQSFFHMSKEDLAIRIP
ncbi:uncharacterized protein LOC143621306 [Bidens hawaiensis]|uniref:uncharacterized protein LOC143621306 n=1 Tax=Bidens hawaiensis TaxID=980011 RepID=UPI00404A9F91